MPSTLDDFVMSAHPPTPETFATTCSECGLLYHWKAFAPTEVPKHRCVTALRFRVDTLEERLKRLEETLIEMGVMKR